MARAPGSVRDAVIGHLRALGREAALPDITSAVARDLGAVSASSIRSYLNLNIPEVFERVGRGHYRLRSTEAEERGPVKLAATIGDATLYSASCFDWLAEQKAGSIHACVTDPPYGLVEYTDKEQKKLLNGKGGIWRIPPSFDGHRRSPLPRFTVLNDDDREQLWEFFRKLGTHLWRVLVPGANVLVASNPLLSHIVAGAMGEAGLEIRGSIVRLTMTMRGGDRPKNAHKEFHDVSVMPRSMFEPWVVLRRPLEGRVQDNLRKWKTGGFRRIAKEKPFGDVIRSRPTSAAERRVAPHPSLKPQEFLRQVVRASLPLGDGIVLDPFAGSGSTLAAANAVGYSSIGIENNPRYIALAREAIGRLARIEVVDPVLPKLSDPRLA